MTDDAGFKIETAFTRRFYHVTPTILLPGIHRIGVDPSFANGPRKVSWWCEKQQCFWALAHISALKSISVEQLSVIACVFWVGALTHTQFAGVYNCQFNAKPRQIYPALDVFSWISPNGEWKNG